MKRIYFFLLLLITFILFLIQKERKLYLEGFNELQDLRYDIRFEFPFTGYFNKNLTVPLKIENLYENKDDSIYYSNYLRDTFGKSNKTVAYIPLYNSQNKMREGYIVLSAGIDGKISNEINIDSLFYEEIGSRLRLYNQEAVKIPYGYVSIDTCPDFTIIKRLFGSKDYLITKVDCIKDYETACTNLNNINLIVGSPVSNKLYKFKGLFQESLNDSTIVVGFNNEIIRCSLVNKNKLKYLINDTLNILGEFVKYDSENKVVIFDNCLLTTHFRQ